MQYFHTFCSLGTALRKGIASFLIQGKCLEDDKARESNTLLWLIGKFGKDEKGQGKVREFENQRL